MGSGINPDDINNFLQRLHPTTYGYSQDPFFGSGNDPRWAPPVMDSDLLSEADYYLEYDDAQSEYRIASTPTVASRASTMRSAAPSSVFSRSRADTASSVGQSSAPSRGGPRVPFAGLPNPSTGPRRSDEILWCEFARLKNCRATFPLDEEAAWIQHHVDHLRDLFPRQLMCWFCDHVPFVAQHPSHGFANFEERMLHVRGHIFDDPRFTIRAMRPDLHMVTHLYQNGLLSHERYKAAMEYDETPAACRLPGSQSHSSSSAQAPLGYQTVVARERGQYHDLVREERHRQRERQGRGRR
jgi:hypothetical protein